MSLPSFPLGFSTGLKSRAFFHTLTHNFFHQSKEYCYRGTEDNGGNSLGGDPIYDNCCWQF